MWDKIVVIINGKGGVGKDTFVGCCGMCTNRFVYNFDSVAIVKEVAKILGWDGFKDNKSRKFLSELKKLSTWYNDQPIEYLTYSINNANDNSLCFVHIREPEEIEKFRNEMHREDFPVFTLLLKRYGVEGYSNDSDRWAEDYDYDYVIDISNTGVEKMVEVAQNFLQDIELKYQNEL